MWDDRYSEEGFAYGIEPNDFLRNSIQFIKPQGKVLCIGEGEGRNALFLKKQGFDVEAVNLSSVGRNKALQLFKESGFEINFHVEDLTHFEFGYEKWGAIVSIFCHLEKKGKCLMRKQAMIVENRPKKVELIKDKEYYFCACGKSANRPFCDGSHKGTSITPKNFKAEKSGDCYLCMCKQSKNLPYCDGSHKSLAKATL